MIWLLTRVFKLLSFFTFAFAIFSRNLMFLWNASFIFVLMFIPIYHLHHLICNLYSGSKGCSCLWLASGCLWPVQAPGYTTLTVRRTTVSLNTAINCPNVCPGAPADFSRTVLRCCPPRPRRLHSLAWPLYSTDLRDNWTNVFSRLRYQWCARYYYLRVSAFFSRQHKYLVHPLRPTLFTIATHYYPLNILCQPGLPQGCAV